MDEDAESAFLAAQLKCEHALEEAADAIVAGKEAFMEPSALVWGGVLQRRA